MDWMSQGSLLRESPQARIASHGMKVGLEQAKRSGESILDRGSRSVRALRSLPHIFSQGWEDDSKGQTHLREEAER